MPSICMLPSLLRPPRDVNSGLDGVALADSPVPGDARDRGEVVAVAAGRGQRLHGLVAQDQFAARAGLDVDDRRHAGDGDRFLDGADPQLRVDARDAAAADVDAVADHRRKPGKSERHLVRAWPHVNDLVLTAIVRHH